MYCNKCGEQLADNVNFCNKCGNNLSDKITNYKEDNNGLENLMRPIIIGFMIGLLSGIVSCSGLANLSMDAPIVILFGFIIGVFGAIIGAIIGKNK